MGKQTIDEVASALKEIKAALRDDIIMGVEIRDFVEQPKPHDKGFVVVLNLNPKLGYCISYLEHWRKRLNANECIVRWKSNQLQVLYGVSYNSKLN